MIRPIDINKYYVKTSRSFSDNVNNIVRETFQQLPAVGGVSFSTTFIAGASGAIRQIVGCNPAGRGRFTRVPRESPIELANDQSRCNPAVLRAISKERRTEMARVAEIAATRITSLREIETMRAEL